MKVDCRSHKVERPRGDKQESLEVDEQDKKRFSRPSQNIIL